MSSAETIARAKNAECGVRNIESPIHSALHTPHSALASARPTAALLSARGLVKSYRKGKLVVPVLKGVDFQVREGEMTAVVGQSGCGKSTLLHLLGTLDAPDAGEIHFDGNRIDNLAPRSRDVLRNE